MSLMAFVFFFLGPEKPSLSVDLHLLRKGLTVLNGCRYQYSEVFKCFLSLSLSISRKYFNFFDQSESKIAVNLWTMPVYCFPIIGFSIGT